MDLEELSSFSFSGVSVGSNILGEKKLNIELRSVNISQNMSLLTPKRGEKSIEKRMLAERGNNSENRKGSVREQSMNKFNSFRNESVNHSIQLKPNLTGKYNASFNQDLSRKESGKENPERNQSTRQNTVDFRQ